MLRRRVGSDLIILIIDMESFFYGGFGCHVHAAHVGEREGYTIDVYTNDAFVFRNCSPQKQTFILTF